MSHKSKSGPVKVIARFEPQPPTPAQQRARLQHKLALLEDRIADRETFYRHPTGSASSKQLDSLLQQRNEAISALSNFGE
mgnify:CR=1 FL=1